MREVRWGWRRGMSSVFTFAPERTDSFTLRFLWNDSSEMYLGTVNVRDLYMDGLADTLFTGDSPLSLKFRGERDSTYYFKVIGLDFPSCSRIALAVTETPTPPASPPDLCATSCRDLTEPRKDRRFRQDQKWGQNERYIYGRNCRIFLYDAAGRTVEKREGQQLIIDKRRLSTGVYLGVVYQEEPYVSETFRIVVK